MDRWKRYCKQLYNKNATIETSHIRKIFEYEQELLPTFSEVEKSMKEIKSRKSPGYDEISAEMIKKGGDNIIKTRSCGQMIGQSQFSYKSQRKETLSNAVITEQ